MMFLTLLMEAIMAGKTKRAGLVLTQEQRVTLKELARSRTAPAREVERAKILIGYAEGTSMTGLHRQLGVGRPMIYRCIDKALAGGAQIGLKDAYVHTPKHGSWLNLIECAYSKMASTFLRHIRVASVDELKTRILKGIDEFNAYPVVFRWNKFDLGIA